MMNGRKRWQKFTQAIWASLLGLLAYWMVPSDGRASVLYAVLIFWAADFGFYVWGNVQEHKVTAINGVDDAKSK